MVIAKTKLKSDIPLNQLGKDLRPLSMTETTVPVLIVGGSLVGLSTAMLLGHHGVESLVVEYHRGTAIHPRAAQISQRTMEIFRMAGIEQIVRQKSGEQFSQDGAIMAVETLAGKELAWYIANLNEGVRDVSPCPRVFVSQSGLEPVLRDRALELGAKLSFGTELVSFEQDAEGVTATVRHRDTDKNELVRARYMVACDGAHSRVREQLRTAMRGRGSFADNITIYFRADVNKLLRGRNLSVIYVLNDTLRGFFRIEKPFDRGFLVVHAVGDPEHPVTDVSTNLTEARCLEFVRAALGDTEVPVAIENVMHWEAEADTAEKFQDRNVFLAGDAAHVMPPNGGFGGNTGVQDAHNLAWKLAWVLQGRAEETLLSTYDTERRPVAAFTAEQAYTRFVTRVVPRGEPQTYNRLLQTWKSSSDICTDARRVMRTRANPAGGRDRALHICGWGRVPQRSTGSEPRPFGSQAAKRRCETAQEFKY